MNIFVLDWDAKRCAAYLTDRHVVKMVTETAQILSSAYYFSGEEEAAPYRRSHAAHPCCVWARQSAGNWAWLKELGLAIYDEYRYRYEGRRHKAGEVIAKMRPPRLPDGPMTQPPLCMPEKYRTDDAATSYRAYYMGEKRHLFSWKKRGVPPWIGEHLGDEANADR